MGNFFKRPADLYIQTLPIRFNFNDNYYSHKFQGIPKDGYTKLFEIMLKKVDILLNNDYNNDREYFNSIADKVVYSGPIDKFFNYKYGKLKYISVDFKFDWFDIDDYQGCAVMSHPLDNVSYTKTVEHKHFINSADIKGTVVSTEYPTRVMNGNHEPYYPVNDVESKNIFRKYSNEVLRQDKFIMGGRLADYKYYDMHEAIRRAMELVDKEEVN